MKQVQRCGDSILEVPDGPVCTWSARETNACSSLLQQYPGPKKHSLTPTFRMHKVRKLTFTLRPPCQIFWALSKTSKRRHVPYRWFQRCSPCYLPIQQKLHHAKAFPGVRCATPLHCPGLSRCTGFH